MQINLHKNRYERKTTMQKFIITYLLATMGGIVTAFGQSETSNAQLEADTLLNQKLEAITISGTSKAGQYSPFSFQNLDSRYIGKVSVGQEPAFLFQQTPAVTAYSDGATIMAMPTYA